MGSDRRLHPASFLFALGGHAKQLLVPGILVLISARSGGDGWETWAMIFIVPFGIAAAVRVLSYRYRFDESELVVRTGFIFRNERHVPYARIQNVDALQNVLHRALGVADVRIETGGASEGEARMQVVSLAAFREVRERVFEGRTALGTDPANDTAGDAAADPAARAPAAVETVLHLPLREVILSGLIEGRGLVVLSGIFGVLWETGLIDNVVSTVFGEPTAGRGAIVQMARAIVGQGTPSPGRIGLTLAAFGVFLVLVRGFSAAWAVVTLYGFRLARSGHDLRLEFGLLTRVAATVPIHRIQALTIVEGPLHRACGRVSIRVDTAGGDGKDPAQAQRQRLAPLLRRDELARFLRAVLPDQDLDPQWNAVDPRGYRRELVRAAIRVTLAGVVLAWPLAVWTLPVLVVLSGWAVDPAPRVGKHQHRDAVPQRVDLAQHHHRAAGQDSDRRRPRVSVRSTAANGGRGRGYRWRRWRVAPHPRPIPVPRHRRRARGGACRPRRTLHVQVVMPGSGAASLLQQPGVKSIRVILC
jgi:putative membrane protein